MAKTYADLFNDIQIFPYGDEIFELQKECSEIDYMEAYINNQLYIRENFTTPNDLLMESLDDDRLNRLITEAEEKSNSWFENIKGFIEKFFKWILKWLQGFWKFITSPFQKKMREEATVIIDEGTNASAKSSNNDSTNNKPEVMIKAGQAEKTPEEKRKEEELAQELGESMLNFNLDDLLFVEADGEESTGKRVAKAIGSAALSGDGKAIAGTASGTVRFVKWIFNLNQNIKPTFEKLNANSPLTLNALGISSNSSTGGYKVSYQISKITSMIEQAVEAKELKSDFAEVLKASVNFKNITYVFITKKSNTPLISLDTFKHTFDMLNSNNGKGTSDMFKGTILRLFGSKDLANKIHEEVLKYSNQNTQYPFRITSVTDFEGVIKALHKVLVSNQKDNSENKYNYRGTKNKSEADNKTSGITQGSSLGNGYVRTKANTDTHFNLDPDTHRRRVLKFYNEFSKASANILRGMQVAQSISDMIVKSIPGMKRDKFVQNQITKG